MLSWTSKEFFLDVQYLKQVVSMLSLLYQIFLELICMSFIDREGVGDSAAIVSLWLLLHL